MKRTRVTLAGIVSGVVITGAVAAAAATSLGTVRGLDGASYLAYSPSVVRETQQALEHQGLYAGPENGVLDAATMKAMADFQKQKGLHPSGVPTPQTRRALAIRSVASHHHASASKAG